MTMEKKIKIGLFILIAGIVVSGFSFKNVNAIPAGWYDSYDIRCKILKLEVVKEETPESYGEAKFTLEIVDAKLIAKGNLHNETTPIKSRDIIEANSCYRYQYGDHPGISIICSIYDPKNFDEGDIIQARLSYAGSESILLYDPKHTGDDYYIYAALSSIAILIIFLVFILRPKRKE